MNEQTINPGYGCRVQKAGERTIANKSERLVLSGWEPVVDAYKIMENICRVPIDCGEGWELVPENGMPFNVEATRDGVTWAEFGNALSSMSVKKALAELANDPHRIQPPILAFRRRIAPKVEVNAGAVEERGFYWMPGPGMSRSEAAATICEWLKFNPNTKPLLLHAVSKFERIETKSSEIRETKI